MGSAAPTRRGDRAFVVSATVSKQWVGISSSSRQLPAALATRGRGAVVLVLPQRLAPHGGEPHSFEVAGCHGFALRSFHGQRESVA